MCNTNIANIISKAYLVIMFFIPFFYLIVYYKKAKASKSKKKNYSKAVFIAFIMFLILFGIKTLFKLSGDNCMNCYLNNKCEEKEQTTTTSKVLTTTTTKEITTVTTTTTTTTTAKKETTTKTTESSKVGSFDKVAEITGTRKDVGTSNKGFTIYEIDGVTYIDGYMIVNKTYTVSKDFVPVDTKNTNVSSTSTNQCADCINNTAWKAWNQMKADAAAVGIKLWIASGYRSWTTQNNIYNRYVSRDGVAKADTYSARPGSSEHQTGLCFDINSPSSSFNGTKEAKWIDQNAYKYGYIIRYPDGKMDETGYKYESWHVRYVGSDLANKLYNNGDWISMENYFGITSKYSN